MFLLLLCNHFFFSRPSKKANHLHVSSLYSSKFNEYYLFALSFKRKKKKNEHTESSSSYWKYFDWKHLVEALFLSKNFVGSITLANWFSILYVLHFYCSSFFYPVFPATMYVSCSIFVLNEMFSIFNYPFTSKRVLNVQDYKTAVTLMCKSNRERKRALY